MYKMLKRSMDIVASIIILALVWPIIALCMAAVWLNDRGSPIYWAKRVGVGNREFRMAKIRSMQLDADQVGGTSTSGNDQRITSVGHYIRRFKLDELLQFWNVLNGTMHLVGPRPNTRKDVDLYTNLEMKLLDVKPGVTDISSIVFSDEGAILESSSSPDDLYDQIIRPWKSRLGLLYIKHQSLWLDLRIVWLTFTALFSKQYALSGVNQILVNLNASPKLVKICMRDQELPRALPPGIEGDSLGQNLNGQISTRAT